MFSDRTVDTSTSSSDAFEWMSLYMTATVQVAGSFIAVGDEIDRLGLLGQPCHLSSFVCIYSIEHSRPLVFWLPNLTATPRSSVSFLQHDAGREEDIELERTVIQLRKVWAVGAISLHTHVASCSLEC